MFLRDIAVQADDSIVSTYKDGFVHKFARDTSCCSDLLLKLIHRKVETEGTIKIALTFTDDQQQIKKQHHMFPEQPDVLMFTWLFPFDQYIGESETEKKRLIFTTTCECLIYLAKQYGWETRPFENALVEAEKQKYQFSGIMKLSWASPNLKYRIRLYYDYGLEFIELYACLFKNRTKTELDRKYLGKHVALQGWNYTNQSSGRWVSETQFELTASTFWREKWEVDFEDSIET